MRSLFVSPIEPLSTGNGLAIRAGMWLEALDRHGQVELAVLPLAGYLPPTAWADARCHRRWPLDAEPGDAITTASDPYWRAELAALDPLPAIATGAWPGTATRLAEQVRESGLAPEVVVGLRSYVGPVVAAAARLFGARSIIDLDDDDLAMAVPAEADMWDRLVRWVGEWTDELAAASPDESRVIGKRLDRRVSVLPNVVRPVARRPLRTPGDLLRMLFVGNLTYEPNREAVLVLVESIIPRCEDVHLTLVGASSDEDARAWAAHDRIAHLGWVEDLDPVYEAADVVVVPLGSGSGTRIKVLEAMAHGRPVVATPVAVAGLQIEPGLHALVVDGADDIVTAIEAVRDRQVASALVEAAARFVAEHHHPDRAFEIVGNLIGANQPRRG